jgi:hypothetical protein
VDQIAHGDPVEQLHRVEEQALGGHAEVVDRDDAGVLELGGEADSRSSGARRGVDQIGRGI